MTGVRGRVNWKRQCEAECAAKLNLESEVLSLRRHLREFEPKAEALAEFNTRQTISSIAGVIWDLEGDFLYSHPYRGA